MSRVIQLPGHPTKIGGRARSFASASSQYLHDSVTGGITSDATFACWFNADTLHDGVLISSADEGSTSSDRTLRLNSSGYVVARERGPASNEATNLFEDFYSTGTWTHAAATFSATPSTSRFAYRNGVPGNEGTTSSTLTGFDNFTVGALIRSSGLWYFNGDIAYAAIWDCQLSTSEILELYNGGIGLDPQLVRPDSLVAYWPLTHNDKNYAYTGSQYDLTPYNDPTWTTGPLIQSRSKTTYHVIPAEVPQPSTGVRVLTVPGHPTKIGGRARSFASASSQYLRNLNPLVASYPLTLSAWVKIDDASINHRFFGIYDNGGSQHAALYARDPPDNDYLAIARSNIQAWRGSQTKVDTTKFQHVVATFTQTYQDIWVDGDNTTGASSPGDTGPFTAIDSFAIGASLNTGSKYYINGSVAQAAMWNVVLPDDKIRALWNAGIGCDPRLVIPDPVGYWPLTYNDKNYAYTGSQYDLTQFNNPTWEPGPLIQSRSKTTYVTIPAAPPTEYTPRFPDIFQSPIIGGY